ncbi:hypothetical protein BCAR13_1300029 [Paraburkholderia caribensis]|nr:hypothetical protein BCAR13_1300029 [Paraburkholderia caribensis]
MPGFCVESSTVWGLTRARRFARRRLFWLGLRRAGGPEKMLSLDTALAPYLSRIPDDDHLSAARQSEPG